MTGCFFDAPIGRLALSAENGAVVGVAITEEDLLPETGTETKEDREVLSRLIDQLGEYFAGKRRNFDIPLCYTSSVYPALPPFRRSVWDALRKISYGEIRSYGEVAAMVGNPNACRAVGNACHVNHLLLVVPCHRVVASNGIGGFGERIEVKRYLLKLEGVEI